MKSIVILLVLIAFASNASAGTRKFYIKFKGETNEEVLDKVDDAISGLKNGKYRYLHQPIRLLYESKGCNFTKPKYIDVKTLTVKKAYRVNRFYELESFKQATVIVTHKRCSHNTDD